MVTSLHNAISRHEYLRGWNCFKPDAAPDYDTFKKGYTDTDRVELRTGDVTTEGAAGLAHSTVPVALKATQTDGTVSVFVGCYHLTQVQPGVQDMTPYSPIQIDDGTLEPSDQPFETAMGHALRPRASSR